MTTINLASGDSMQISETLYDFVRDEVVSASSLSVDQVFEILGDLIVQFGPKNRELLEKRDSVQSQIDSYYINKRKEGWTPSLQSAEDDARDFEEFLMGIGYLGPARPIDFRVNTPSLDTEMEQNGPELVTPVTNASMVVGGANARWGSLYDAYFLSDINPSLDRETQRPERLRMVVNDTNKFLDEHITKWSKDTSFNAIQSYGIQKDENGKHLLTGRTYDGDILTLEHPEKFIGFHLDESGDLSDFFLIDNGLRIQAQLYPGGYIDKDNGQFKDLLVESAITNIIDFEDAVTIVDAEDMVLALRNYLGVMTGDLVAFGSRGNLKTINSDKTITDINNNQVTLKATSLMSVRNVSLHMYTDMVQVNGEDIPERILGLLLTTLIASSHDKGSKGEPNNTNKEAILPVRGPNSNKGFVYQVTPKLQTSEEVAEQIRIFEAIEERLNLSSGTILIGIMNEELGMTLQLAEAIQATKGRTFFINTGFLDRTGSQIRVQMQAGPVHLRDSLNQEKYITSYELHNVDVGIQTGVHKTGKIGKGMQTKNRAMSEMMEKKIDHPRTGGNTAWVPAPYPSDLHSMHYHIVDVDEVQSIMEDSPSLNISRTSLLTFPLLNSNLVYEEQSKEDLVLRYIHSMYAYAEPWINRGVGCSGVLSFDGVEEMKDRATERIDGVVLANWKLHGIISQADIEKAISNVVSVVDEQNSSSQDYIPLGDTEEKKKHILSNPTSISVMEVIDEALSSTSAFVEPAMFRNRIGVKNSAG